MKRLYEHCLFCGHSMAWHKWGRNRCLHAGLGTPPDCQCEVGCSREDADAIMKRIGRDPIKDIAKDMRITQKQIKAVIHHAGYGWNRVRNVWEKRA